MRDTPIVAFLYFVVLASARAMEVDITQEWERNFGWQVTCLWSLDMDDSLQSVTLSRNKQQFFIFRPETMNGEVRKSDTFNLTEVIMAVDCMMSVERGIKGRCRLSVEPLVPPNNDFTFQCSVSGERPYFKFAEKEITVEALVPPSEAIMTVVRHESGPATINCTSSGVPTPRIIWTVDNQTVPHSFHTTAWNETTKLWDVWSSFTPQPDAENVQCTPEVAKQNKLIRGLSVQYSSAYRILLDGTIIIFSVLTSLFLK